MKYQKMFPLWFDTEAKEAVEWYTDIFPFKITMRQTLTDTPSGDSEQFAFSLMG